MWIDTVIGFLSAPVTAYIEGTEKRKYLKEEGAHLLAKAEVAFKIAELEGKAQRALVSDVSDSDYDKQAQLEKRHTIADEILILCTIVLVGAHFFVPEKLAAGWSAMGYTSTPWWLEFIIVGIFVSVFGLMRLFRAMNPFANKSVTKVK